MLYNRVKASRKSSGERSLRFSVSLCLNFKSERKKKERTVLQPKVPVITITPKQEPMKLALEYNGIQNGKDLQRRKGKIEHRCGFLKT